VVAGGGGRMSAARKIDAGNPYKKPNHQGDSMSPARSFIFTSASAVLLAACAGQPETYQMNQGQSVTMPKGTMTGAAYDQAQLGGS
jgi:hypothetical protein